MLVVTVSPVYEKQTKKNRLKNYFELMKYNDWEVQKESHQKTF